MIGRRLLAVGVSLIFLGTAQALEAGGFEYAIGDCVVAAAIATVLVTMAPKP